VDVVGEAKQMLLTSTQIEKVHGLLMEILNNCSSQGTRNDVVVPYQKQPQDADGGHHAIPLS